jgi:hypothetical protein
MAGAVSNVSQGVKVITSPITFSRLDPNQIRTGSTHDSPRFCELLDLRNPQDVRCLEDYTRVLSTGRYDKAFENSPMLSSYTFDLCTPDGRHYLSTTLANRRHNNWHVYIEVPKELVEDMQAAIVEKVSKASSKEIPVVSEQVKTHITKLASALTDQNKEVIFAQNIIDTPQNTVNSIKIAIKKVIEKQIISFAEKIEVALESNTSLSIVEKKAILEFIIQVLENVFNPVRTSVELHRDVALRAVEELKAAIRGLEEQKFIADQDKVIREIIDADRARLTNSHNPFSTDAKAKLLSQ